MPTETRQWETAEAAYVAFCADEPGAFDQIMGEFQQSLTFFLLGYVRQPETAEDLAEETFVELLLHKGRFRGQSSFKTYLFSVARHKAIDFIRRQQRRPAVPLDEMAEQADVGDFANPEAQYLAAEQAEELRAALAELPADYREVLRLLYVERLRYDEIAAVLHKNSKQVDNLSYRARNALRAKLEQQGKEARFLDEKS